MDSDNFDNFDNFEKRNNQILNWFRSVEYNKSCLY